MRKMHGYAPKYADRIPEYQVWQDIKKRCLNPNGAQWKDYGGRGIKVCARWEHDFEAFLKDMGRRPTPQHTINRINNDGNYEPQNCTWSTRLVQSSNQRQKKCARIIKAFGREQSLTQWALECNLSLEAISYRLKAGWSVEDALLAPIDPSNHNGNKRKR